VTQANFDCFHKLEVIIYTFIKLYLIKIKYVILVSNFMKIFEFFLIIYGPYFKNIYSQMIKNGPMKLHFSSKEPMLKRARLLGSIDGIFLLELRFTEN